MATLSIDGIDEEIITQLQVKAKRFNINNNYQITKSPSINSLFDLITSSTDGMEFQNAMREE